MNLIDYIYKQVAEDQNEGMLTEISRDQTWGSWSPRMLRVTGVPEQRGLVELGPNQVLHASHLLSRPAEDRRSGIYVGDSIVVDGLRPYINGGNYMPVWHGDDERQPRTMNNFASYSTETLRHAAEELIGGEVSRVRFTMFTARRDRGELEEKICNDNRIAGLSIAEMPVPDEVRVYYTWKISYSYGPDGLAPAFQTWYEMESLIGGKVMSRKLFKHPQYNSWGVPPGLDTNMHMPLQYIGKLDRYAPRINEDWKTTGNGAINSEVNSFLEGTKVFAEYHFFRSDLVREDNRWPGYSSHAMDWHDLSNEGQKTALGMLMSADLMRKAFYMNTMRFMVQLKRVLYQHACEWARKPSAVRKPIAGAVNKLVTLKDHDDLDEFEDMMMAGLDAIMAELNTVSHDTYQVMAPPVLGQMTKVSPIYENILVFSGVRRALEPGVPEYDDDDVLEDDFWFPAFLRNRWHDNEVTPYPAIALLMWEDLAAQCETCGRPDLRESLNWSDIQEMYFCEDCYDPYEEESYDDRRIFNYSYKPTPKFFMHGHKNWLTENDIPRYKNKTTDLFIGMELEVAIRKYDVNQYDLADRIYDEGGRDLFYIKEDSSISDGFEVVTHPFTPQWGLKNFPFQVFNDLVEEKVLYENDESCGQHIHVSRSAFTRSHLMKFLYFHEKLMTLVTDVGGRSPNTSYANYHHFMEAIQLKGAKKQAAEGIRVGGRSALNLSNEATIELRYPAGNISEANIRKNMEWVQLIYDFTKLLTPADINELDNPGLVLYFVEAKADKYPNVRRALQSSIPVLKPIRALETN